MITTLIDQQVYCASPSIHDMTPVFLNLLQMKSPNLYRHSHQVANYSASIAAKMCLPSEEISLIQTPALLHDIGHVTVPNLILAKSPYLSQREYSTFKNHCRAGVAMMENIAACQPLIPYILHHHERWDGTGYPKRLKGVNIPLGARIIAVADYYDSFINPCTQNWRKTKQEALKELQDLSGTALDSDVVKAFKMALG